MINRAFVSAGAHSCITEWSEFVMVGCEYFPGFSSGPFQYDDHEGPHQESCVCLLGIVETGVVINFILDVLLITNQLLKFFAEKMYLAQVEGSKIRKEGLVH